MKKFLLALSILSLPLVACTNSGVDNAATSAPSETWTERRDEFISGSQAKLEDLSRKITDLEKRGKLVKADDSRKARNEAKDLREDIADLKEDLEKDAPKVSAGKWEEERVELQSDLNELEQEFSEYSSLYR
ncbi:MAG: hypothetical protein V4596_06940 [Bdellovibrionota bacterium]